MSLKENVKGAYDMEDRRYIISEAVAKIGLEAHVLRYWEEELGLVVPRNELGHRYYTEELIEQFKKIKELKEKGYQLKAIKSELYSDKSIVPAVNEQVSLVSSNVDKMEQFKNIIGGIVTQSLRENNSVFGRELSHTVSDKVIKEMDYLLRLKDEAEEDRYKRLDETIRNCQRSNREAAAGRENKKKRRKR